MVSQVAANSCHWRCGVAEARVVQPLRADEQDVHRAVADLGVYLLPVLEVGGVDGARVDAGPRRGVDLVAHQREQRGDDDGRPGPRRAQQRGRDEVDRGLAPAGALHHERAPLLRDEGADRCPLVVPQPRMVARERPQVPLCLVPQFPVGRGAAPSRSCLNSYHGTLRSIGRVTDTVSIRDLRVSTVIGVYDWEREIEQALIFSVDMAADVAKAAARDDIADTLDYSAVAQTVKTVVIEGRFQLIETAAERVAERLIADYGLDWVRVEVVKPIPSEGYTAAIAVERPVRRAKLV